MSRPPDKLTPPHDLLATGKIETSGGRQRVHLRFNRIVLSGTAAELIRSGDGWELRQVQDGKRTINHDPGNLSALCWEPWEEDDRREREASMSEEAP
ncbi:MAG: hypothetical protein J5I93_07330 [Pirellulaceae bacterium]|nr:hypothetical protein [Pirellulaceae bacterium]